MDTSALAIQQTRKWITEVVAGLNFCPFAARELRQNSIHYQVETARDIEICLRAFLEECIRLDETPSIETSLLIYTMAFQDFESYLDFVELAERLLKKKGYEGVYQVASFHPLYRFASAPDDDPANYTNRSIYPMLHLLREETLEQAIKKYAHPEQIPENNIKMAREKGIAYMKLLRDSCL